MSMVYIYLTHDTVKSPAFMARFAEENGYSADSDGTKWSFISEGGERLGLDVTEITLDKQRIDNNLNVGNPVICRDKAFRLESLINEFLILPVIIFRK
jgi:hypothetical protein